MHTIASLHIYPIKSLGGISLSQSMVQTRGLQHDRRWMLVDEKGQFLTQREDSRLALFRCQMDADTLTVTHGTESLEIPLAEHSTETRRVKVWSSSLRAPLMDPRYSEWFSDLLGQPCSLVKMTQEAKRPKRLFTGPYLTELSFADAYPILILGTASHTALNERCPSPVPLDRFRANIIIHTTRPHEEDDWAELSIQSATLKVIKPCARCQVISIDQQTAEKGKEPTRTLAQYRQKENKILFGANAIVLQEGRVSIGDELTST